MTQLVRLTATVHPESAKTPADAVDNYLFALYMNGQITSYMSGQGAGERDFFAVAVTPAEDALNPEHNSCYVEERLRHLEVSWEVLGNDTEPTETCNCSSHHFYWMDTMSQPSDIPVRCGDCGNRIPLYRVPHLLGEQDHSSLLNWQKLSQSVDTLWMESLSDRFSKRQITSPASELNRRGAAFCRSLEKASGVPAYLYLRNPVSGWWKPEKNNRALTECPACAASLRPLDCGNLHLRHCPVCRLIFDRPAPTDPE